MSEERKDSDASIVCFPHSRTTPPSTLGGFKDLG